jgi:hypothetical protein
MRIKSEQGDPCVAYRVVYSRITKSPVAGLVLSQIAYWFAPDKNGRTKLRVKRENKLWLAKTLKEMMSEVAITRYQCNKALASLKALGLIETRVWKFQGEATTHIWLDVHCLDKLIADARDSVLKKLTDDKIRTSLPHMSNSISLPSAFSKDSLRTPKTPKVSNSYTEITQETLTETTVTPLACAEQAKASDTDWVVEKPAKVEKENPTLYLSAEWYRIKAHEVLSRREDGVLSEIGKKNGVNSGSV